MSNVFVIQNQEGQFLSRQKEWLEKTEINALYKTPHRDLAVNELFEITSKDTSVRAKVVSAEATSKGLPLVAELPPLDFPKFELPEDLGGPQHASEVAAENEDQTNRAFPQLQMAAVTPSPEQADEQAHAKLEANTEQV
jgi:hypothetical protein